MTNSFFGLTSIEIEFLSMIGTWVASIGTLGAVIVSLYLALANATVSLNIKDCFAYAINTFNGTDDKFYHVKIINLSDKSVTIDQVGIKLHNKQVLIVPITGNLLTTQLPKSILYGENVIWSISTQDLLKEWIPIIKENNWSIKDIKKWRIIVSTSIGQNFEKKICKDLINFYKNELNR